MSDVAQESKYDVCAVCGKQLNQELVDWAWRKHEQQTCSTECSRKQLLAQYACCDKMTFLGRDCTCMYAFKCPDHGERHVGTHD